MPIPPRELVRELMVMLFSAHRLGPVSPASCRCGDYNWALTAP
jgi:hypothetical protein